MSQEYDYVDSGNSSLRMPSYIMNEIKDTTTSNEISQPLSAHIATYVAHSSGEATIQTGGENGS